MSKRVKKEEAAAAADVAPKKVKKEEGADVDVAPNIDQLIWWCWWTNGYSKFKRQLQNCKCWPLWMERKLWKYFEKIFGELKNQHYICNVLLIT